MHDFKKPRKQATLKVQPDLASAECTPGEQFGGGSGGPPTSGAATIDAFDLKFVLVVGLVLLIIGSISLSMDPGNTLYHQTSFRIWLEGSVLAVGMVMVLVSLKQLLARYRAERIEFKAPGVRSLAKKRSAQPQLCLVDTGWCLGWYQ